MIGRTNAVIAKSGGKWPSADDVQVTYTGDMAEPREITDEAGNKYILYELTSSGTLTVDKTVPADVCVVASGGNGFKTTGSYFGDYGSNGGVGGVMINATVILSQSMECAIGVPTGDTGSSSSSIALLEYSIKASSNGTGAGGHLHSGARVDLGDGKEKFVFGDESVYSYPICAGGGGGGCLEEGVTVGQKEAYFVTSVAPNGGTNGGNGVQNASDAYLVQDYPSAQFPYLPWATPKGEGGNYGGGSGAYYTAETQSEADIIDATDAFTYGSGGGGAIMSQYRVGSNYNYRALGNSGKGYQGVIFIRILK